MNNESFQLVQANAVNQSGLAVINATYRSNLATSSSIIVEAVADSVETANPFGISGGVECCPIVASFPQETNGTQFSVESQVGAGATSSTLLPVPQSLKGGAYVVDIFVTSPSGVPLSPLSYMFLDLKGIISGGQAGAGPIFYDSDNGLVYVGDSGLDAISIINGTTGRFVATVSLPEMIGPLVFYLYDHGNRELYVGSGYSPDVFALDTSSNFIVAHLVTTEEGQSLTSMVYDSADGKIFGIDFVYSRIIAIDDSTNSITSAIDGIQGPLSAVFDSRADELLVKAYNGTTYRIDGATNAIVGPIQMNVSVFYSDRDDNLLYAYNQAGDVVALNSSTFQQVGPTLNLGNSSSFVLYNTSDKDLYFYTGQGFGQSGGYLLTVNTTSNTLIGRVAVPGLSEGQVAEEPSFVFDPSTGDIYATELTNPQNYTVGLLQISDDNVVISQAFPSNMTLGPIVLDPVSGMLFGTYVFGATGSSSVLILNLHSGKSSVLQIGTILTYGLPP
jgi:hypothetical protein